MFPLDLSAFNVIAIIAIAFLSLMLFLALFEPSLPYRITSFPEVAIDSPEFHHYLEALTNAPAHHYGIIDVLTNGEVFYEAELDAISNAYRSISIVMYKFRKGEVAQRFVDALTERARAGVSVNLVIDALGSFGSRDVYFKSLIEAGGRIARYHPFRWYMLPRIGNRTHRALIVVDGKIGFIGGAGIADYWLGGSKQPRWRDTMLRVEGKAVAGLQATFVQSWLEASGDLLGYKNYFPYFEDKGTKAALVVASSPTAGMATRARILFQILLASAQESILITSPYFLPDRSARAELVRAIRERGVKVKIITPGLHNDHLLTRRSSRRLYGELLKAGAEIYEYEPAMLHTKSMIVDGVWSVVGSTNFDNRSFGLNDEVNLAAFDHQLAERLEQDFRQDVAESRAVSYDEWRRRSILERAHEWLGSILERQQ